MKILIVDDEGIILNSCRRVLAPEGYEVVLSKSAAEAMALLQNDPFSAVLVDMKMPEQDGIALMKSIREKWKDLPIIIMSGYATDDAVKESLKMGANAFVPKPFTPDELSETVSRVVKKSETT